MFWKTAHPDEYLCHQLVPCVHLFMLNNVFVHVKQNQPPGFAKTRIWCNAAFLLSVTFLIKRCPCWVSMHGSVLCLRPEWSERFCLIAFIRAIFCSLLLNGFVWAPNRRTDTNIWKTTFAQIKYSEEAEVHSRLLVPFQVSYISFQKPPDSTNKNSVRSCPPNMVWCMEIGYISIRRN